MNLFSSQSSLLHGHVASGFEEVQSVFMNNFAERGELGAACAVYFQGKKVVDLWGGHSHKKQQVEWKEDTIVPVFSATKGIASVCIAIAHSRGWIDFEQPVASYWPAFAQNEKQDITVRQLLDHQAGLPAIDTPLDGIIDDLDAMADALASQKPFWKPGKYHGYHSATLGWYEAELLRQVDPQSRSLGQFLQEEVMKPLGEEFYIGLPLDFPEQRLAYMEAPSLLAMPLHLDKLPWKFIVGFLNPWSLSFKTVKNPKILQKPKNINRRDFLSWQVPAVNGVGKVSSIARIYGELAIGGGALGLIPETYEALCAPATLPSEGAHDLILRSETAYSLGYMKSNPTFPFCPDNRSFGTPGAGGSLGFADPKNQLGFAYGATKMSFYVFGDPRETLLREAVYRCVGKL